MGTGYFGGFGNGTEGSKKNKPTIDEQQSLINELKSSGAKITEKDVVFVTRDKTGQIVWLEEGNSSAGLKHIVERHASDFKEKHGIDEDKIPAHLKHILTDGTLEYSHTVERKGRSGYEKLFSHNNQYYLLTGVGSNGFIVSAYPIDESMALKLKGRYEK